MQMDKTMQQLEDFRKQIDACDEALIEALARRFDIVRKVGELKTNAGMEAIQPARAQSVKDRAVRLGQESGLDPDFMRRVYEVLIDYAHDVEHDIIGQGEQGSERE